MKTINGMETARSLRENGFQGFLIFMTILKEMVFEAFGVQAYDYLVKPIKESHFQKTMERLFVSIQNANETNLLVHKSCERSIIPFDKIIFCEIIPSHFFADCKRNFLMSCGPKIRVTVRRADRRSHAA